MTAESVTVRMSCRVAFVDLSYILEKILKTDNIRNMQFHEV